MTTRTPLPPFTGNLDVLIEHARTIETDGPHDDAPVALLLLNLSAVAEEARMMRRQLSRLATLVEPLRLLSAVALQTDRGGAWHYRVPEDVMRELLAALPAVEEEVSNG